MLDLPFLWIGVGVEQVGFFLDFLAGQCSLALRGCVTRHLEFDIRVYGKRLFSPYMAKLSKIRNNFALFISTDPFDKFIIKFTRVKHGFFTVIDRQ